MLLIMCLWLPTDLPPLKKNFYIEAESVSTLTPEDICQWRSLHFFNTLFCCCSSVDYSFIVHWVAQWSWNSLCCTVSSPGTTMTNLNVGLRRLLAVDGSLRRHVWFIINGLFNVHGSQPHCAACGVASPVFGRRENPHEQNHRELNVLHWCSRPAKWHWNMECQTSCYWSHPTWHGRWKVAPSLAVLQLSPHTSMSSLSPTVDPLALQSIAVHRHGGWCSMRILVLFLVAPVWSLWATNVSSV